MPRSVTGAVIGVDAVAVLLPVAGSAVTLESVALFTIGSGVVYAGGTRNVTAIVCGGAPAGIVPSAHGKPALHGAEADTNTRPGGAGSPRDTPTASDGPALVAVIE
jgi:hypothetical protein